jgi:hypothetical protein
MTLPSAPDVSQIDVINRIYWPEPPLGRPVAHRHGRDLSVGEPHGEPLFFLIQGPLMLNWRRRIQGIPFPRMENGELSADHLPTMERFRLWADAHVHVHGREEWIFIKVYCHGLQERALDHLAGPTMRAFLAELLAHFQGRDDAVLHFVSPRQMANAALAAVDGQRGDPHKHLDYHWRLAF